MRTFPAGWMNLSSRWCPHMNYRNVLKFAVISGSPRRKSGVPWKLWASTAHCSKSVISPAVKNPIKLGASPSCGFVDSSTGDAEGGDGDGDSGLSATPGTAISKENINWLRRDDADHNLLMFNFHLNICVLSKIFFLLIHPRTTKFYTMKPLPPALNPTPLFDDFLISFLTHSFSRPFEFFTYPNQTPTLTARHLFLLWKALIR